MLQRPRAPRRSRISEALPLLLRTLGQRGARHVLDPFEQFDEVLTVVRAGWSEADATVASYQ